jgi:tight adherence protein C
VDESIVAALEREVDRRPDAWALEDPTRRLTYRELDAELVAGGSGALAAEVRGALQEARAGRPLAEALGERARRLGVAPLERFVEAVVIAQERGMPLADSLRAMAFEVRENEKRSIIEAGGRKQISMLMPVVCLILPVAIVFAFYPGLVAIRTLAR